MNPAIPVFPVFREITFEDKDLFSSYFEHNPPNISEFTYTNFFIWRLCDRSKVTSIYGNLCVLAEPENEPPYFFEPLGRNEIENTIEACFSRVPRFSRISEEFAGKYFKGKKNINIVPDRDNFDYLYRNEDLKELKGKKFDGKRNRINKLLKHHAPVYKRLTDEYSGACLTLLNAWKTSKGAGICFDGPIKEALMNMDMLGLKGAVVLIDNKVEAFTIGEKLNPETAVIYIEVANQSMDGLSQYINQQFCRTQWQDCIYINREQDLGDAGLRRAKLSYHPTSLINKYNVTLID